MLANLMRNLLVELFNVVCNKFASETILKCLLAMENLLMYVLKMFTRKHSSWMRLGSRVGYTYPWIPYLPDTLPLETYPLDTLPQYPTSRYSTPGYPTPQIPFPLDTLPSRHPTPRYPGYPIPWIPYPEIPYPPDNLLPETLPLGRNLGPDIP